MEGLASGQSWRPLQPVPSLRHIILIPIINDSPLIIPQNRCFRWAKASKWGIDLLWAGA